MFRLLEYIIFFLLGYKLLKLAFADNKPKQKVKSQDQNQHINSNNNQQTRSTSNENSKSKFNDAEFIDYEEVK